MSAYLKDCLSRKILFFTGKGGVGKTSLATATALLCEKHGKRVSFLSWTPLEGAEETPAIFRGKNIEWVPLESTAAFKEYALKILRFERIYDTIFENAVLKTFIMAAPGLSETVVAGKIWDLNENGSQDLIIVDLPASGHAYSFFQSPFGVKRIFKMGFVYKEALKIVGMFESRESRLDFVGIPEEMSVQENIQFYGKLKSLANFSFGFLHLNQCLPSFPIPNASAIANLPEAVQNVVTAHASTYAAERDSIRFSKELPLQSHEIPRYSESADHEIIQRIATHLETV